MQEMNVKELAERIKAGNAPLIIDVREPNEYAYARIPGAVLKPLGDFSRVGAGTGQRSGVRAAMPYRIAQLAGGLSAGADGLHRRSTISAAASRRGRLHVDPRARCWRELISRCIDPREVMREQTA